MKSASPKRNNLKNVVPFNAQGVNEHFWKSECEKKTNPKEKRNLRKKPQNNWRTIMKSLEATNSKGHA